MERKVVLAVRPFSIIEQELCAQIWMRIISIFHSIRLGASGCYMRPNMYCIFIVSTESIKYDSKLQPDVSIVAELQLPSIVIFMCCALGTDRHTRER